MDYVAEARKVHDKTAPDAQRLYALAINELLNADKIDLHSLAKIADESGRVESVVEHLSIRNHVEDAAFVAKITGRCELARDLYQKAGNTYYAQRMQDNIDAAKKSG